MMDLAFTVFAIVLFIVSIILNLGTLVKGTIYEIINIESNTTSKEDAKRKRVHLEKFTRISFAIFIATQLVYPGTLGTNGVESPAIVFGLVIALISMIKTVIAMEYVNMPEDEALEVKRWHKALEALTSIAIVIQGIYVLFF